MPAGMVHTLHDIHRVLTPDGLLLDLRPSIKNRVVLVDLPSATLNVGEFDSSATTADKQAAHDAMAEAVADGLFVQKHLETFDMTIAFDTVDDLRAYADSLRRSILPEDVLTQVETLTTDEDPDTYAIRIRRPMHLALYQKQIPNKP